MLTEQDIQEIEKEDHLDSEVKRIFPVRLFAQAEAILERHFEAQSDHGTVLAELLEKIFTPERADAINKLNSEVDPTKPARSREHMADAMMNLYATHRVMQKLKGAFARAARKDPAPQDMPEPTHPGNGTFLI